MLFWFYSLFLSNLVSFYWNQFSPLKFRFCSLLCIFPPPKHLLEVLSLDFIVRVANLFILYILINQWVKQPCLGGDSKTLMFVNVSPDPSSVSESLCSLRFAARVNACEIGIPRRQANMRSSSESRLSYGWVLLQQNKRLKFYSKKMVCWDCHLYLISENRKHF